jgi:hypothetical protein
MLYKKSIELIFFLEVIMFGLVLRDLNNVYEVLGSNLIGSNIRKEKVEWSIAILDPYKKSVALLYFFFYEKEGRSPKEENYILMQRGVAIPITSACIT